MKILKCVADADRICNLIKGDIAEPDDDWEPEDEDEDYKELTEQEIIERQRRLPKKKKEPEEDHTWMHTHDGGGSFVITGKGSGLFPHEVTLTRFTPLKVRR